MENGLASERRRQENYLKFGQAGIGNAPVLKVEVLLALKQQSLHAKPLLEHRNWQDGMSSGFGEAWAVALFHADSGSLASSPSPTARAIYAGKTNQIPGGGAP
jgi:hypothetical protein